MDFVVDKFEMENFLLEAAAAVVAAKLVGGRAVALGELYFVI